MMRFLKKNNAAQDEKEKFSRLKQQCKYAVNALLSLSKQQQALHCALVIGQPETGKSILCASFAQLLFSTQNLVNVEKKNSKEFAFEIYLHHKTLFFQIPPEFFLLSETQGQQRLWHYLATQLKKHYLRLPTTRCLVCIDLYDCLTRSKASNDTRLTQINLALTSIATTLRHTLDVSIFFTKADLLLGFSEFFEHESKEFLEQTWGFSLGDVDTETISIECDQLIRKANERLIWSLHHEIHLENLYLIKTFPLILENMKQKLTLILPDFLNQWSQHRYLQAAELYFVSCRQFKELSESANTNNTDIKAYHQKNHHKVFFVKQATERQCDYQTTSINTPADKAARIVFIILCGLLLTAFILYNSQQFARHISMVQSANQTLETALVFAKKPYSSLKSQDVTNELNAINIAWKTLNSRQQSSRLDSYIFPQDTQLDTQLQNVYQRIISLQWLPLITRQLENYINNNLSSHPANAYIAFQLYLMLSQPGWPIDTQYIQAHLGDLLGNSIDQIYFLNDKIQKNILVVDETSSFIEKTRAAFAELPTKKLAYIMLFASIDLHHSLSLNTALDLKQPSLQINSTFANIPEIYTKNHFEEIYTKRLSTIAKEALHGNQVLGVYHHDDTEDTPLVSQLQEQYIRLYSDAWEKAIQHINLTPVNTLAELATQLNILTSVNSPILNLLNLSQTNTSIPQIEQASAFLSEFNRLLTKKSTPENNALYRSFALLIKLHDSSVSIENNNIACTLLDNENTSTPEHPSESKQISALAAQLASPVQDWMQQIADSYDTLLKNQAGNCS